jgi:excisionase family DNA binding protein
VRTHDEPTNATLVTPEALAKQVMVSRRTVTNWVKNGVIPMIRIGRVCRFDPVKVKQALERFEKVEVTRR